MLDIEISEDRPGLAFEVVGRDHHKLVENMVSGQSGYLREKNEMIICTADGAICRRLMPSEEVWAKTGLKAACNGATANEFKKRYRLMGRNA